MSSFSLYNPDGPASDPQQAYLDELILRTHLTAQDLKGLTGKERLEDLTKGEASTLIDLLRPEQKHELIRRLAELRGQLSF